MSHTIYIPCATLTISGTPPGDMALGLPACVPACLPASSHNKLLKRGREEECRGRLQGEVRLCGGRERLGKVSGMVGIQGGV